MAIKITPYVYECPEAPANRRFVAHFLTSDNDTTPVVVYGREREATREKAQNWLDAEIAKAARVDGRTKEGRAAKKDDDDEPQVAAG